MGRGQTAWKSMAYLVSGEKKGWKCKKIRVSGAKFHVRDENKEAGRVVNAHLRRLGFIQLIKTLVKQAYPFPA